MMTETEELELLELEEAEYQYQKSKAPKEKSVVDRIFETIDSYTGAPVRSAIGAVQDGKNPITAYSDQFGEDPSKAPTGKQIAQRAGVSDKPIWDISDAEYEKIAKTDPWAYEMGALRDISRSGAAGFGIDVAADPTNLLPTAAVKVAAKSAPLLSKGAQATGKALKTVAETSAFKSSGAMLKDFRAANGQKKVGELGRYMLDNDLKMFDSVDDINLKFTAKRDLAGKKLDEIYKEAGEKFGDAINKVGFDPKRDKAEVLAAARNALGDAEGSSGALNRLSKYIDEVAARHGDKPAEQAAAAFKRDFEAYLPKYRSFLRDKAEYKQALGKAGEDLNQPALSGMFDDLQRTKQKPTDVEIIGKDPSVARVETPHYTEDTFLSPLPQQQMDLFNPAHGDSLVPAAQKMALDTMSKGEISSLGKQASFEGLELTPRQYAKVNQPVVEAGSGQTRIPFLPEKPIRPTKPGDIRNPMSPRRANDIKGAMDDVIDYSRNPLSKEPASETAFSAARHVISKKVDAGIESLGGDKLLEQLKGTNREYGNASEIARISKDKSARLNANQMYSLTDNIAGGAGAAATSSAGGPVALAMAAVTATTSKLVRKYGATTIAVASDRTSKFLLRSPEMKQLAQTNPQAFRAVVINMTRQVLDRTEGLKAVADKKPGELDRDSSTPANEKVEPKPTPTPAPKKGRDKWASDGFDKVAKLDSSLDKDALLSDPKKRELLIAASDLKPGSKAMDRILEKLKKGN